MDTNTHTHTYTHIHRHTHIHAWTQTHTHTHIHRHTHIHAWTQTHTHTHIHTHIHAWTQKHTHTHTHTQAHTDTCMDTNTHMYAQTQRLSNSQWQIVKLQSFFCLTQANVSIICNMHRHKDRTDHSAYLSLSGKGSFTFILIRVYSWGPTPCNNINNSISWTFHDTAPLQTLRTIAHKNDGHLPLQQTPNYLLLPAANGKV